MLNLVRSIDRNKAEYKCGCGNTVTLWKSNVRSGHTKSCGCLRKDTSSVRSKTHGHKSEGRRSRVYVAWVNMKARCNNGNRPDAKNYSDRGIGYDPRWEKFQNFLADMGEPPEGYSLDRVDNEGGYSKDNCRWADKMTQNSNKRTNVRYEYDGRKLTLPEWEAVSGVKYMTIFKRIQRGVPLETAIFHKGYLNLNR